MEMIDRKCIGKTDEGGLGIIYMAEQYA